MEEMRAILDSLMGKDRDASLSDRQKKKKITWKDPEVCKHYLLDFCPHDLFPNTKRDLGECKHVHSDGLKQTFQDDPDRDKYISEYETDFMAFLEDLIDQVEQKIRKGNERIVAPSPLEIAAKQAGEGTTGDDPDASMPEEKRGRIDVMNSKISSLLQEAQEAGEMGDVKTAEALTTQICGMRREIEKVRREGVASPFDAYVHKERQLRVCAICGAMQSLGDSMSRFESHIAGKQHQGFEKIRTTLEVMKDKRQKRKAAEEEALKAERATGANETKGKASGSLSHTKRSSTDNTRHRNESSKRSLESGKRSLESGKRSLESGKRSLESRKRSLESGRLSLESGRRASRHSSDMKTSMDNEGTHRRPRSASRSPKHHRTQSNRSLERTHTPSKSEESHSDRGDADDRVVRNERYNEHRYKGDKINTGGHGERYRSRDEKNREDRYREERSKDGRYNDDRYKDECWKDDQYSDDRYKDGRYSDDRYKDGRYSDDRYKNGRYNDEGYTNGRYNDERYTNGRYNDERYKSGRYSNDRYMDKRYNDDSRREERYKDDRFKDGRYSDDRYRDDRYTSDRYREDQCRDDRYRDEQRR